MRNPWRPTRALGRATAIGVVLVAAAAVGGRADLAVIGVPLVALVVWAAATRPTAGPAVRSRLSAEVGEEGDSFTWRVDVTTVPGLRDVVGHLPGDRWTTTTPEHGHVAAASTGAATVPMAVQARIDRWGVRRLGPGQVGGFSDFAAFTWTWPEQRVETIATVPTPGVGTVATDSTSCSGEVHTKAAKSPKPPTWAGPSRRTPQRSMRARTAIGTVAALVAAAAT